jgi:aspartate/glutamate racemase
MKKRIYILHTGFGTVTPIGALFSELIPEAELSNIVDDSLLKEAIEYGGVTPGISERFSLYIRAAESGADLIFNTCAAMYDVVNENAKTSKVPLVNIGDAMAKTAAEYGGRILVLATVAAALEPTAALIKSKAAAIGKNAEITIEAVEGALAKNLAGDAEGHNLLIAHSIVTMKDDFDVIVLAQGSMAAALPQVGGLNIPILTSPESGVKNAREILFG